MTIEQQKDKQEDSAKTQSSSEYLVLIGGLFCLGSFLIPAYQALRWIMTGAWQSLTTTVLFSRILPTESWAYLTGEPTSWIGLHKILSWICCDIPLFLFVLLFGMFLILIDR